MKKGLMPIALGTAVTTAGIMMDKNQKHKFRKKDYQNMTGAFLVGAGVAHIALGGIDLVRK